MPITVESVPAAEPNAAVAQQNSPFPVPNEEARMIVRQGSTGQEMTGSLNLRTLAFDASGPRERVMGTVVIRPEQRIEWVGENWHDALIGTGQCHGDVLFAMDSIFTY